MKKGFSKALSVFLVIIMLVGSAPLTGLESLFTPKAEATTMKQTIASMKVGDLITYGSYPQTDVTSSMGTTLTNAAPATGSWKSYNYYIEGEQSDYMKYYDLLYGGNRYRGVYFSKYRPFFWSYSSSSSNTYQDNNGYTTGKIYWFRYDPLTWRILDPKTGYVICENIIDSQAFNDEYYEYYDHGTEAYYNDKTYTHLANNWEYSTIRKWLNETFFTTAFSSSERSQIPCTKHTTPAYSTSGSAYDVGETGDYIFLPTYQDMLNASYGFSSSYSTYDINRRAHSSDYAKSQGVFVFTSYTDKDGKYTSYYHLRSAGDDSYDTTEVYYSGYIYVGWITGNTDYGIRPALCFNPSSIGNYAGSGNTANVNKYDTLIIEPRNIQSIASYSTGDDNLSFIQKSDGINLKLENVSLKIGDKEYSQSYDKTFSIPLDEITDDIVLSRDGYYNYIIPKEVAQSFYSTKSEYKLNAWMAKDERTGKKPYISSVFAKVEGSDTNYVDIRYDKLSVEADESCEMYISAGNISANTSYVISQDESHKISKSTRAFTDDLANLSSSSSSVVYVKDKNGTSKAVSIKLSKSGTTDSALETVNNIFKDGKISLGGKNGLSLTLPKSWPLIGGSSLSLLDFKLPVGFDLSADGTVRASLGFDWTKENTKSYSYSTIDKETGQEHHMVFSDTETKSNWDKSVWENLKKDISSASSFKNAKDKKAALDAKKNLLKRYGMNASDLASSNKKGFDVSVSALGYAEGKLVGGKLIFTEVHLSIAGGVTISITHQSTGYYVSLEGGGSAQIAADLAKEVADSELPLEFDVTLSATPSVKASGGVGAKGVISAGVYGKASLPTSLGFKNGHFMISLKGEIGAEAEVLFFKTGEISILSGTLGPFETYLWGTKSYMVSPNKIPAFNAFQPVQSESFEITGITDRDESKWVGSATPKKAKSVSSVKTIDVRNLQTDVYSSSEVKTITCGDTTMAVWIADDSSRNAYNRLKLVYSIYDKETNLWSEPKAVYDDGHIDAMPEIATDGENIYVVWQKFIKDFNAENSTDTKAILSSGEIYLSKYDFESDSFVDVTRVTNNNYYDYSPVVTVENGVPVVFYADSIYNGISESGGNKLNKYVSGEQSVIASDISTVINLACSNVDGKAQVAYCVDTDGNMTTTDDISVYYGSDSFEEFDSEMNSSQTNISYATLDGNNTLFVSDGTNIYYKENGDIVSVLENSVPVSEQITSVNTDDGLSIFFASSTDEGNEIYTCSYSNGEWSDAVKLTERSNLFTNISFENIDGSLIGLANESKREYDSNREAYVTVGTNLVMLKSSDFSDLTVDLAEIRTNNVEVGKEAAIYVTVTNNGNVTCEKLSFEISDNNGVSNEYDVEAQLLSGKSDVFILPYEVTENLNNSEITVKVYDEKFTDINSSDNSSVISEIKADMIPESSKIEEFDDAYVLSATLINESVIDAENITVKAVLNDENNEALTSIDIDKVSSDSPENVELIAPKDSLVYDENGNCIIYFIVSADNNETITESFVVSRNTTECEHKNTGFVESVEATCTKPGQTGKLICFNCNYVFEEGNVIEAINHLDEDGNGVCDVCNASISDISIDEIKSISIEEGEIVKLKYIPNKSGNYKFVSLGSSDTVGYIYDIDGNELISNDDGENDENFEIIYYLTGEETYYLGVKFYYEDDSGTCKVLLSYLNDGHEHYFNSSVTNQPTCVDDGLEVYTCECGESYTEVIDKLGHDYVPVVTPPTCVNEGYTTYTCSRCKDSYTDSNILSHGHASDEGTVTKPATCTTTGTKTYRCTVCGEVIKTETTAKIAHKNVTIPAVAATCEKAGKTAGTKCSVCGVITKVQTEVAANGHKEVVLEARTATAKKSGLTAGKKCSTCGKVLVAQKMTLAQVTGLKASIVAKTSIKLSWTKIAGAKYYKVEQSTDGKTWKAVKTVDTNSYTVSKLTAGKKYQFRVTALDSTKKIAGKASTVLKTGTLTSTPTVTLKSSKSKTAVATWKKVTGASKYTVYKSTDGKKWTKVTTTDKLTYTLTKLTGGKKIYVKVTAVNAYSKESAASSVKNVTVKK